MKKESDVNSPQCVFGVANDELMLANSVEAFEMAYEMSISNDDPLAESIEYRLIRQRIKSQLRGRECSLIQYQNTIESLVSIYEMAKRTEYLSPRPGITGPLGSWLASFNGNQLPPFEIISKYLAPAGAFLSEEANDLHYTVFWLRRD